MPRELEIRRKGNCPGCSQELETHGAVNAEKSIHGRFSFSQEIVSEAIMATRDDIVIVMKSILAFRRIKIQRKKLTEIGAEQRIHEWIAGSDGG
jgi:hypothetical protein